MNEKKSLVVPHIVAFLTVAVWGTTFVWTKLLLNNGLSPAQIFTLRFVIAYLLLAGWWLRKEKNVKGLICKDEPIMAALGLTGGSLYFLSENAAMLFTTATNTSLIVCACPIFTAILIRLCYPITEKMGVWQWGGSVIALVGMAIVVLNGHFVLHLSPLGDALAFIACMCWAVYSLIMRRVGERYSTIFVTRKVFFYGLLTIIPYHIIVEEDWPDLTTMCQPVVWGNLLFLGCVASMVCYLCWNWCMVKLGAVNATNWVYFNPITTIVFAWLVLDEHITHFFLIGTALILVGIAIASSRKDTQ